MKMFTESDKQHKRELSSILILFSNSVRDQNPIPENNHIVMLTLSLEKASTFYVLCYKISVLS